MTQFLDGRLFQISSFNFFGYNNWMVGTIEIFTRFHLTRVYIGGFCTGERIWPSGCSFLSRFGLLFWFSCCCRAPHRFSLKRCSSTKKNPKNVFFSHLGGWIWIENSRFSARPVNVEKYLGWPRAMEKGETGQSAEFADHWMGTPWDNI